MKKLYWIIFIVFLVSCNMNSNVKESQSASIVQPLNEKRKTETDVNVIKDSLIIENSITHEFSQPEKKDVFSICIKGKSLSEGKVIFTITSSNGVAIHKEEFPSYLLMDYGYIGNPNSIKEREGYMKKRIIAFFNEKYFTFPAIKTTENYDKDYSDKEIWDEIKSNKSAVGFFYSIGEEDGRKIAFSKKKGKAVLYFNCC